MSCPSPTGSGESVLTMATSAFVRAVTRFDVEAVSFEVESTFHREENVGNSAGGPGS